MTKSIKGIIFDMDGTLLDTLMDIAISNNEALKANQFNEHPVESYKEFVGNGIRNLVKMSLPKDLQADQKLIDYMLNQFRSVYREKWHPNTIPYPGIEDLLNSLSNKFTPKAIVTNKSQEFADIMVSSKLGQWKFDRIIGEIPGKYKKPDPTGANEIINLWNLMPEEVAFIGDSTVDIQTAKNSGTLAVAVNWGFDPPEKLVKAGADLLIEHPSELLNILKD